MIRNDITGWQNDDTPGISGVDENHRFSAGMKNITPSDWRFLTDWSRSANHFIAADTMHLNLGDGGLRDA
jgi:hypothetical protein